jgi:hypothetical protein
VIATSSDVRGLTDTGVNAPTTVSAHSSEVPRSEPGTQPLAMFTGTSARTSALRQSAAVLEIDTERVKAR